MLLGALLLVGVSESAYKAPTHSQKLEIKISMSSEDYLLMAAEDLAQIDPANQRYIRYLTQDPAELVATNHALNMVSQANYPIRGTPVANGHLMRVDLRKYDPRLRDWTQTWELLAFDPAFSKLITQDTIKFAVDVQGNPALTLPRVKRTRVTPAIPARILDHPGGPLVYPDGSTHVVAAGRYEIHGIPQKTEIEEVEFKDFTVLRFNTSALQLKLQIATGSLTPVVDGRYFIFRSMSTIKEDGPFKDAFGGLYYEFAGIKVSADPKVTDEDLFFQDFGIGFKGETAEQFFDRLESDQRTALRRSRVTDKPRRADIYVTQNGKHGDPHGSTTHDIANGDVDIGANPLMNLLKFQDRARETIVPGRSGYPKFLLTNNKGKRQDVVPPNVAGDRTVPSPATPELQAAIGCIRCHGPNDGWQPMGNDVKSLTKVYDIFTDLSDVRRSQPEIIDRLVGLYDGDFDNHLTRMRNDFSKVVFKAVGLGGTDNVKVAAANLSRVYAGYWYDEVDAHKALFELGTSVPKEKAVVALRLLVQPTPLFQDARIGQLLAGQGISRSDFSLIRAFIQERLKVK